jgi:hypothetical protein
VSFELLNPACWPSAPKETMVSTDAVRQFALKNQWQRRDDGLGIGASFK